MKPNLIVRKGNRFVVDTNKILPYMRKSLDLILNCLSLVCEDLKANPDSYNSDPKIKLDQLNSKLYDLLKELKVYKD